MPTPSRARRVRAPNGPDPIGDALVLAQSAALAGLLWPGRGCWRLPAPLRRAALLVGLVGGGLSLSGAGRIGRDLTPRVAPRPGAPLQTGGVYALSRNPIYAGLLITCTAGAVLRRRPEPLLAAGGLAAVLHVKVGLEERRLKERFGPDFDDYARRVPRLIGMPAVSRPRPGRRSER